MLKRFLHKNVVLDLITTNSTTPKFNPLLRYCITASESKSESESDTQPSPVSFLFNNFGFSNETESPRKAFNKKQVCFNTIDKPNSIITFFKSHGIPHSNIAIIIRKHPWLLSYPHKRIFPKFQFFLSKGVFSPDIVSLLTANPRILQCSLEKRIIPLFGLLSRFLKTNKDVIVCLIRYSKTFNFIRYRLMVANIKLMTDFGVSDSNIIRFLQTRPFIFGSTDLIKSLEEVKGLGFHPSRTTFGSALIAKIWDEKFDTFKKWGWSSKTVLQVFRFQPILLSTSVDKINLVMDFWVNQLGWDSSALIKWPLIFHCSLHKRIIPRAAVLQFLLMKGLREKNACLVQPFIYNEKSFLRKFVFSFKEESDYLLKLYEEKRKLAYTEDKINGMPFAK